MQPTSLSKAQKIPNGYAGAPLAALPWSVTLTLYGDPTCHVIRVPESGETGRQGGCFA